MAISLYDASVANYLRGLDALGGVLDKGLAFCRDTGVDPEELVAANIGADMRPFRYQITSTIHHSLGAVEALMSGIFRPPGDRTPYGYAALQTRVAEARTALRDVTAAKIAAREGADLTFEAGEVRRAFTTEGFVLSFSLPNFYFHATTAYDILRMKGVPLVKRDYLGALRLKE